MIDGQAWRRVNTGVGVRSTGRAACQYVRRHSIDRTCLAACPYMRHVDTCGMSIRAAAFDRPDMP
ncbi:MAG: hypothetical protein WBW88_07815, partial [Rhodothermales bacterium]